MRQRVRLRKILAILLLILTVPSLAEEALSSWKEGPVRQAIIDFVQRVTDESSSDFVPEEERIAVFDNDGTLWSEQPAYFQLLFALDRVRAMAPDHPEWKDDPTFKAVLDNDMKTLALQGKSGLAKVVATSHAGMTTDQFARIVAEWLKTARHPQTRRPYNGMVFQPMLELLTYLRGKGFKTYIVSGGGIEFMRVFAQETYGVPPEQVVGSRIKTEWKMTNDGPVLMRTAAIDFVDDGPGKPVGINNHIGRKPIAACGNSDGDLQMLQWSAANNGFCLLVHHTDAEREWAYDKDSHIGHLEKALEEATKNGWTVVDMKNDWKTIYPK